MKIIDLHCDTLTRLNQTTTLRENNLQIDLLRLKKVNMALQHFAIFIDTQEDQHPYDSCLHHIDVFHKEMVANSDLIAPMLTYADYLKNQENEKISALLTIEDGAPIGDSLDNVSFFYDKGVRMMTLTWNYENTIGTPNCIYADSDKKIIATEQTGLTPFGIEVVQKMNELGMVIDVSHGSDQLVRDVLTYTDQPFVASHSNARDVTFHSRNLPNPLIKEIANRGGVIGLNFARFFLTDHVDASLLDALVDHAKHLINVGGENCLALGSDFDGIPLDDDLPDVLTFPIIYDTFQKNGIPSRVIDQIFYKNVEQLYQRIL